MNIIEQWKPIKGYEGIYEVSSLGRVKSLKYGKERILKLFKTKGYLRVDLCRDGKMKFFLVHRLVAEAFLPNPMGFNEINHIDEDKTNNAKSNLEWCDRSYNVNYGSRNEKVSKAVEASKYPDFREIELRFPSTKEAGRNGYGQRNVSACCRGCLNRKGNNKYRGLFWRFAS